jgi:hypothetical protein
MSLSALLDRLDDRLNPIVVKELRQAVQSRLVVSTLMLFLTVQMVILGTYLIAREFGDPRQALDFQAGRTMFMIIQGILLGTCMLLIPGYVAGRLALERSDSNVDLLFISTLRPRSIIWGKFASAVVLALMIFSACAPFMTFTYLLRGIDIPSIVLVLALDLLAVLGGTQLAVFLAAAPANRAMKGVLVLGGLIALIYLCIGTIAGSYALLEMGAGLAMDTGIFWAVTGSIVAGVLGGMGLLFAWSVAFITPASANRVLPVRLYLLGLWLVTLGIAAAWTYREGHLGPIFVWMMATVMLFTLQLLISVNEREQLGPRITRTIPRRRWLRVPLFLVYSGAASGVLFSTLVLAGTIGLTLALKEAAPRLGLSVLPGAGPAEEINVITHITTLIALYTFCYSLTAVLVRTRVLGPRVPVEANWIIALTLLGLGCTLPFLLLYLIHYDDFRYRGMDLSWWLVTNPFASILDIDIRRGTTRTGFASPALTFTTIWAMVIAALNMPWFLRQVRAFQPLVPKRPLPRAA